MADSNDPPRFDRDDLIEQHRSYVRALAFKVKRSLPFEVELDELVAYGTLGLVEAAQRFNPLLPVAFTTFSYYRIRGAIYDGLREMGHLSRSAHAPTRFAANAGDLLQSADDDEHERRGEVTDVESDIASAEEIIERLIAPYLLSLESERVREIPDPAAFSEERAERSDLLGLVVAALRELPDDERQLIEAIYFKYVSMTELAARRGVNKSWISRLHARAINHLRESLRRRGLFVAPS
ncbi:MAG TPA: sigma-70 family RNA polymerase sigma factor [Pyrinomonadaceae bacterium]|jgi:RNA polymerase sigma factor for flagellar operon FliA